MKTEKIMNLLIMWTSNGAGNAEERASVRRFKRWMDDAAVKQQTGVWLFPYVKPETRERFESGMREHFPDYGHVTIYGITERQCETREVLICDGGTNER